MTFCCQIPWCLEGVEIILEPACRDYRHVNTMHITSCRNVISIKHSTSAVFVVAWLVLLFNLILSRFREMTVLYGNYTFSTQKVLFFKNLILILGFILYVFF